MNRAAEVLRDYNESWVPEDPPLGAFASFELRNAGIGSELPFSPASQGD